MRDQVLAFLADQLALGEELAQVVADASFDDLPEALVIFFDLEDHGNRHVVIVHQQFNAHVALRVMIHSPISSTPPTPRRRPSCPSGLVHARRSRLSRASSARRP